MTLEAQITVRPVCANRLPCPARQSIHANNSGATSYGRLIPAEPSSAAVPLSEGLAVYYSPSTLIQSLRTIHS